MIQYYELLPVSNGTECIVSIANVTKNPGNVLMIFMIILLITIKLLCESMLIKLLLYSCWPPYEVILHFNQKTLQNIYETYNFIF